jgi:Calx-beta domain
VDDDGLSGLTISDETVNEGDSGTTTAVFTILLSPAVTTTTVTVDYVTANGTALAGSDYAAKSGTLTFDPGITSIPVYITVYGDDEFEPDERFAVRISNGNPAPILGFVAYATITNDDNQQLYLPFIIR